MSSKGPVEVVLGPKYAVRLVDLREWHQLWIHCWGCRKHTAVLKPKLILAQIRRRSPSLAATIDLKEMEQRMRCSECGAKACCWIKVVMMERNT